MHENPKGLTNIVAFWSGQKPDVFPAGTSLVVFERSQFAGHLFLNLQETKSGAALEDLELKWSVTHSGRAYVLLMYTGRQREEEPLPAIMVLRVGGEDRLVTIAEEEFREIYGTCIAEIGREPYLPGKADPGVLGVFPNVEI
jgi:hypothetical protein